MVNSKSESSPKWYSRVRRHASEAFGRSSDTTSTLEDSSELWPTEPLSGSSFYSRPAIPFAVPARPPAPSPLSQRNRHSRFWIVNNKPIHLEPKQKFAVIVQRMDNPGPNGYVKIILQKAVRAGPGSAAARYQVPWRGVFSGITTQHWEGNRQVIFRQLKIKWPGDYRIKVEIIRQGVTVPNVIIESLYSANIHQSAGSHSMEISTIEEEPEQPEDQYEY